MDFGYSAEQDALRQAVRQLLSETDSSTYRRLSQELGALGIGVPDELGGSGGGITELGLVLQEAGRALLSAPLLACVLATRALLESGDEQACSQYLPGITAGKTVATLALMEPGGWDATVETSAVMDGAGWLLTGRKEWVLDGPTADLLVVSAGTPAGLSLFVVETNETQLTPVAGVDPTRAHAHVELAAAPGVPLGVVGDGQRVLDRVLDLAVVLLAAEQLGVAERCLEMATAYAKERNQFGRAIGSFQAIKQKLANVLLEVEAARSAVMYALWAADDCPDELPMVACIAGSTCSETALLAASENIQVHGGIGCTWEHPAHLYLKRATTDRLLLGDPQRHLERLAEQLDALPARHLVEVAR